MVGVKRVGEGPGVGLKGVGGPGWWGQGVGGVGPGVVGLGVVGGKKGLWESRSRGLVSRVGWG